MEPRGPGVRGFLGKVEGGKRGGGKLEDFEGRLKESILEKGIFSLRRGDGLRKKGSEGKNQVGREPLEEGSSSSIYFRK